MEISQPLLLINWY